MLSGFAGGASGVASGCEWSCTLSGALDIARFERAWQRVVDEEPVLRTSFAWKRVEKPLQVVHRRVAHSLRRLDWRGLSAATQQAELAALLHADRELGFDPAEAPLMRVMLCREADQSYRLVWRYHGLVLDTFSLPLCPAESLRLLRGLLPARRTRRPSRLPAIETMLPGSRDRISRRPKPSGGGGSAASRRCAGRRSTRRRARLPGTRHGDRRASRRSSPAPSSRWRPGSISGSKRSCAGPGRFSSAATPIRTTWSSARSSPGGRRNWPEPNPSWARSPMYCRCASSSRRRRRSCPGSRTWMACGTRSRGTATVPSRGSSSGADHTGAVAPR